MELKVGDIINFKHTPKNTDIIENIIEKITRSKYHHTAMVIGFIKNKTVIIEAQGIEQVNLDILELKEDDYDVFRTGKKINENKLVDIALGYLHKKYDYTGVLNKIPFIGKLFKDSKKRVYCSELVEEIYKKLNIEINGKTPSDISKNGNLTLIKA